MIGCYVVGFEFVFEVYVFVVLSVFCVVVVYVYIGGVWLVFKIEGEL